MFCLTLLNLEADEFASSAIEYSAICSANKWVQSTLILIWKSVDICFVFILKFFQGWEEREHDLETLSEDQKSSL